MNENWNYYRTCLGYGPDAPRAIKLDIRRSAQEHYSFIFKTTHTTKGDAIEVTATWEYFDKRAYFLVPAGKSTIDDVFSFGLEEERTARAYLRGAGITAGNWPEFIAAGRRILDK